MALNCLSGGIYGANGNLLASAADVSAGWSPTERARMFGRLEGAIWMGQTIGPSLGGVASNLLGPQRALVVPTLLSASCAVLGVALMPETLPRERRAAFSWRRASPLGGLLLVRDVPHCLTFAAGLLFAQWGISTGLTSVPLFCKRTLGWPDGTIGAVDTVYFAANGLGLLVCMPALARRVSAKSIAMLAGLSSATTWILLANVVRGWELFAVVCVAFASAMIFPIIRTSLVTVLGPQLNGVALGIMSLVELVCQLGAPAAASATWHVLDVRGWPDHVAFAIAAAEVAVALGIFAVVPGSQLRFETSFDVDRLCEGERLSQT